MASPREAIAERIVDHLHARSDYWNAPYGIFSGVVRLPRGGAFRSVTFGVSRWLDAEVRVWSPSRIEVRADGALAARLEGEYRSVDELLTALTEIAG